VTGGANEVFLNFQRFSAAPSSDLGYSCQGNLAAFFTAKK
jgi:hypothetical protein